METIRNLIGSVMFIGGVIAVVFVGPAMGMNPGVWIVTGGLMSMALAGVIADI